MLTFSHDLYSISASPCSLFQGVSINIEPIEGFAYGVFIPHLETMLSIITHVIGQFNDAVLCLENVAYIR